MQKLVQFVFFKAFLRQFFGLVAQRKEEKLCAFPLFSALLFRKRRQRSLLQLRHRDGAQCRKVGIRTIVRDACDLKLDFFHNGSLLFWGALRPVFSMIAQATAKHKQKKTNANTILNVLRCRSGHCSRKVYFNI
jgi:hypothetical protein